MKTVRLEELTKITSGFAFKSDKFSYSHGIPLVRIRDVKRGYTETYYSGEYDPTYIVKNGDILIGMDGEFNAAKWCGGEALLNQRVCKIETDESKLTQDYLYYFLPNSLKKIENQTPSVTVKHLSVKKISDIEIPLPQISEQKRIAAILDKADAIRRKRRQAIQLADEFLRSVFLDMFGDPVSNPRNWQIRKIEDIGVVQGGLQLTPKREAYPIELPYLRVANVFRNKLDLREIKTIKVTGTESKKALLKNEDILIVEGHGNRKEIGRSAIWDGSIEPCTQQNHLIRLRVNKKIALPNFVSTFLNSPGGRRRLFKYGKTTSGLNTISTSNVKKTEVFLPDLELQKQFAKISDRIEELRKTLRIFTNQQNLIIKSLSHRAFRGEL